MNAQGKLQLPAAREALPGRQQPVAEPGRHLVLGTPTAGPYPAGHQRALFGMGCFWGAERLFWQQPGVFTTAVGYAGGFTPNPTYEEVCSGRTGHAEVVLVVFDPAKVSYEALLQLFWESHDPTQGMRQGNDVGTQYRSGIYTYEQSQATAAMNSRARYQRQLQAAGFPEVSTEIAPALDFYFAESYHQQYLARVPNGYCGLKGTGVCLGGERVA